MHSSKLTAVMVVFVLYSPLCPGQAESELEPESARQLDEMVVVASKQARPLQDVAGTVRVIDATEAQTILAQDFEQLFRYQPAVSTTGSGTRFGSTGVSIRGIGGNRVAIEVDGVPVNDQFAIGNFSNAGRGGVDPFFLQRAEILSGPASSLYGSDAIGGVLAIQTWELPVTGEPSQWRTRAAWDGSDHGRTLAAMGSGHLGGTALLAGVSLRHGRTQQASADSGALVDPQHFEARAGLAKIGWNPTPKQDLSLSLWSNGRDTDTEIRSVLGQGRFRSTTALSGDDEQSARTLQLDWQGRDFGLFNSMDAQIYRQHSEFNQLSLERRKLASPPVALRRVFRYEQQTTGLEVNAFSTLDYAGTEHALGMGLELLRERTEELRDALQRNLITGEETRTLLGETFPVRDFPISEAQELGAFLYDEIGFAGGRFSLIPGLRYDRIDLQPQADPIFQQDNPNVQPVVIEASAWSPRLGLVVSLTPASSLFFQYAHGFRAPPVSDVNIGLDIPLFNIRALPNPDLVPEESDSLEFGWRHRSVTGSASVSLFYSRYDDFIESRAFAGVDPDTGTLLFQSRNLNQAEIYGLEFDLRQSLEPLVPWLENTDLILRGFWAEGEDRATGEGLLSLSPPQLIAGLTHRFADNDVAVSLVGTFTRRKDDLDFGAEGLFQPPGSGVLDLLLDWQINSHLRANAGLFNLTDRAWWRWSNTRNLPADDPVVPLLSEPGRHLSVSITGQW